MSKLQKTAEVTDILVNKGHSVGPTFHATTGGTTSRSDSSRSALIKSQMRRGQELGSTGTRMCLKEFR